MQTLNKHKTQWYQEPENCHLGLFLLTLLQVGNLIITNHREYGVVLYNLAPWLWNKAVLKPRVSPAFAITHLIAIIVISDLTLYQNMNQRSLTPRWPLTPSLLRSHVWNYPRIIVCKSHVNTSNYVDTVTFFVQTFNQRSLTHRWPFTPSLLRSHVWLYPRIIVSKSHENTSECVDKVTLFSKT